jgi:hypothetical protein
MNIFLSFLQSDQDYPIPAYGFWQHYIKNGITEAGHTWSECPDVDWALGLVPKSPAEQERWKTKSWSKTIARIKKTAPDLFLSYLYPEQIDTGALADIRKSGIPCVNFFCDHIRNFRVLPSEFGGFDLNWVPEYKALEMYDKAGYPHLHLPMPVWIPPADRLARPEQYNQLTFIGSRDEPRKRLLESLLQMRPDVGLKLYGFGWKGEAWDHAAYEARRPLRMLTNQFHFISKQGPSAFLRKLQDRHRVTPLSPALLLSYCGNPDPEHYIALTAQSRITMGINRYPSFQYPSERPDSYSRLRDLEAPMLGACYLTEYAPGIDQLYDTDTEINTYRTVEELAQQVCKLGKDSRLRLLLKKNGQRRALAEHTVVRSVSAIQRYFNLE